MFVIISTVLLFFRYRTTIVSRIVCICVWSLSLLVMLPIVLYATTSPPVNGGPTSCTISWPGTKTVSAEKMFIWYGLLLGFTIPVSLISVFYAMVVLRLKKVGPKNKSKEKKKSRRKVTKLVLTVITVYVICWLPYWVSQVYLTFKEPEQVAPVFITLFKICSLLSYSNSMLNPLLYAFLSENFRQSFIKAFKCASISDANRSLHLENTHCASSVKKTPAVSIAKSTKTTRVEDDDPECETALTKSTNTYDIINAPVDCKEAHDSTSMLTQV